MLRHRRSWMKRASVATTIVLSILALLTLSTLRMPTRASEGEMINDFMAGEVLAQFKPSISSDQMQAALARFDLTLLDQIETVGLMRLRVPAGQEQEFVARLRDSTLVEYAAPNYRVYAAGIPNDPFWSVQWNMEMINAPAGWDVITGSQAITIAILDTGVDLDHPDLASRLVMGRNLLQPNLPPSDYNGHGTHVAGIVGAATNNARGVAGVDWQARLMPVKVLNDNGEGDYYHVINGIYHAVANGARILNMSFVGWQDDPALKTAVSYAALTKGCLVFAAAGNCATGQTGCPAVNPVAYPASYEEAIAVAAVTREDRWANYSEYHSYVDIAAPGGTVGSPVWSTSWNDSYSASWGTSSATPHVAGLAGLIWAIHPALTREQVWAVIRDTAMKVDSYPYINGRNDRLGYGRIDVDLAVRTVAPRLIVSPTQLSLLAGDNRPQPIGTITVGNANSLTPLQWNATLATGVGQFDFVSPVSGTLPPGGQAFISVRPVTAGLIEGSYLGSVRFASTSRGVLGAPRTVNLRLTYKPRLDIVALPVFLSTAGGEAGYEWLDAKRGGIALSLADDDAIPVSLPFAFPFYGQSYNQLWVSSNGFVTFASAGATAFRNACLPDPNTPNNAIYAFWDDLDPSVRGGVYVKTHDPTTYVVQWDGVPHAGTGAGAGVTETFQIVLKADGAIKLQYQNVSDAGSCTVGLENANGSQAEQVWCKGVGMPLRNRKVFPLRAP